MIYIIYIYCSSFIYKYKFYILLILKEKKRIFFKFKNLVEKIYKIYISIKKNKQLIIN